MISRQALVHVRRSHRLHSPYKQHVTRPASAVGHPSLTGMNVLLLADRHRLPCDGSDVLHFCQAQRQRPYSMAADLPECEVPAT